MACIKGGEVIPFPGIEEVKIGTISPITRSVFRDEVLITLDIFFDDT